MSDYYKDSGFQWIGRIPRTWEVERIKRIVSQNITDGPHETPTLEEEGIPFISAEAIKSEKIDFDKNRGFISLEQHEKYSKKCKPQKNDIFIIKSGATTGNVAYVDTDIEFNIWSPLAVIRCDENKAYYKFVFYQFLSDVFRKQVELSWSFGTQENIGMGVIGRINLVIPTIIEQHRIAAYLDKTCAVIDKAIEAKQKQLKTLDALRKSIIHKAVTRGLDDSVELKDSGVEWLGRIPSTWHSHRIKDAAKLSPGFSVGKPSMTDLCTVMPMEAVSESGEISTDQVKEFSSISGGLTNFEVGDVIFAKITPCMENGKGAYITSLPTKYAFGSTEFHVLRPGEKVDGKFLYYYTFNSVYRKYAEKNMAGAAGQKRVSSNFLRYTRIYLPDVMEQRNIADYLDEKCSELTELQATIVNQISTLEQYRKSLIHECVTGKRRITEDDVQDQL